VSHVRNEQPRWLVLVAAEVAFGGLLVFGLSPRTALYWYVFPLFGFGICYLVQFRSEFSNRWRLAFAACAIVSPLALGLDWAFSGHVLWNVLFIGHARMFGKRRRAWIVVLALSLLHLIVLKVASQTGRDVLGAGISFTLAAVFLRMLSTKATPSPGNVGSHA
jgi:hypothetical protein